MEVDLSGKIEKSLNIVAPILFLHWSVIAPLWSPETFCQGRRLKVEDIPRRLLSCTVQMYWCTRNTTHLPSTTTQLLIERGPLCLQHGHSGRPGFKYWRVSSIWDYNWCGRWIHRFYLRLVLYFCFLWEKFLPLVSILECHPDALVSVSNTQQTIKLAFIGGLAYAMAQRLLKRTELCWYPWQGWV